MRNCKGFERDLVAFLYGELAEERKIQVESHLDSCRRCRQELAAMDLVFKGADSLRENISEVMAAVDWDSVPDEIVNNVFKEEASVSKKPGFRSVFAALLQPRWKPVFAGLLTGLVLGSLLMFWVLRIQHGGQAVDEGFHVSRSFLDRVELEMARRATLDYLEKSQYVLLDFIQGPIQPASEGWRKSLASQKAKDLLMKKKYIDPQLNKFRLAKAKEICDQIEFLFFELAGISEDLSEADLRAMQNLI
jgi:hypothetical protein